MENTKTIRFNNQNRQFYGTLKKRIDDYFRENKIAKTGNANLTIKTIVVFLIWATPYVLLITNTFTNPWIRELLWIGIGVGMALIGLCVMHDANHGSYSKNRKVNTFMGLSLNLLGGHALNWRLQHNVLHHTYTNIHEMDEDIAPPGFMRFEPHAKLKKIHKLQFIYAWFFYGLMTFMWSTSKDFQQLFRYNKMGLVKGANTTVKKEVFYIVISKILFYGYMLVLPFIFLKDASWWQILLGYFSFHFTCGIILAAIFQPAHVVEDTTFPKPNESGDMETDWAVHQILTTANFATRDKIFSWFVGGLNFQVEHHLFPMICHVHYPKISKIVAQTAAEFNLPYHAKKTFVGALWTHEKMLWKLGRGK